MHIRVHVMTLCHMHTLPNKRTCVTMHTMHTICCTHDTHTHAGEVIMDPNSPTQLADTLYNNPSYKANTDFPIYAEVDATLIETMVTVIIYCLCMNGDGLIHSDW